MFSANIRIIINQIGAGPEKHLTFPGTSVRLFSPAGKNKIIRIDRQYGCMDKTGLATLLVGIVLLIIGVVLMWYWLPQFIQVLLGGIGIVLAVAGLCGIVLGYLMIKE